MSLLVSKLNTKLLFNILDIIIIFLMFVILCLWFWQTAQSILLNKYRKSFGHKITSSQYFGYTSDQVFADIDYYNYIISQAINCTEKYTEKYSHLIN